MKLEQFESAKESWKFFSKYDPANQMTGNNPLCEQFLLLYLDLFQIRH